MIDAEKTGCKSWVMEKVIIGLETQHPEFGAQGKHKGCNEGRKKYRIPRSIQNQDQITLPRFILATSQFVVGELYSQKSRSP